MGDNAFLANGEGEWGDPPQRVYARIDQSEEAIILIDAIDASWFDNALPERPTFGQFRERWLEARIFVVELRRDAILGMPFPIVTQFHEEQEHGESNAWLEITFGNAGIRALLYRNLYGEGQQTFLSRLRLANAVTSRRLNTAFSLDGCVSTKDEILAVLQGVQHPIEWVGVYDVGQGGANGLCDAQGVPSAYFDLGGGVLANAKTFSTLLHDFCYTSSPPVILSHWDWDHWSSGNRFARAQALTWIVPNQQLGAVHATFAARLLAQGRLLVWPSGLASVSAGQIEIAKCTGNGRNQSGLAINVTGPQREDPILLTGDARYSVIPGSGTTDYTSVVVPHHGADMHNSFVPLCPMHPSSRAAYSCGVANTFAHPRLATEQQHHNSQWRHSFNPHNQVMERNTWELRPALGHIGLSWLCPRALPFSPCGGQCSLQLTQQ